MEPTPTWVIGDGSNAISAGTSINAAHGIFLNGSVTLNGNTTIDAENGGTIELGSVDSAAGQIDGLALNTSGDINFDGDLATSSARLAYLSITDADNVTVLPDTTTGLTYTLWVSSFDGNIAGTLSVGQHSLESDGDVSIIATTVEGRIVAGNDVTINATNVTNTNVTAQNNIQVAAVDVSDSSFTATRAANIGATDNITNSTITAGVANISATNITTTTVTATDITANAQTYTANHFNSPNAPALNGGDATQGGNTVNGQPVTSAIVQLASLQVPTNATNPQVAAGSAQDGPGGGDSGSGGGHGDKKKKGEKGKSDVQNAADKHKPAAARTYDAANQFLNGLLSGKKP